MLQQTGSGDSAVIQKVTWTGGHVPTEEDSLFQFLAQPAKSGTYTFQVEQTYSDGSIVDWSGRSRAEPGADDRGEELARRAAARRADDRGARRRRARRPPRPRSRCSPAAAAGRGSWLDAAGGGAFWRARRPSLAALVAARRAASAHAYLTKTFPVGERVLDAPPPDVALTYDEAVEPRFAIISVTDKDGHQETTGPVSRSPANPDTLSSRSDRTCRRAGTSSTGGRSRSTGIRCRARSPSRSDRTPGPAPQFRDPAHRADGDHDAAPDRALARVPRR